MRHTVAVAVAVVALLPFGARADEPTPGSSQGGSPAASAPAGYRVSTELPGRISVNKKTGNTSLTATVRNGGTKEIDGVKLKVVGFQGMRITSVEGCTAIPTGQLPPDSNSGFVCAVDKLAAGQKRAYRVAATFDLGKTGQVCLPVTLGDGKTLLWQQGPVHFGTTDTSSDAPDTPLLLGTKNVPSGPAATPSGTGGPGTAPGGTTGGPRTTAPATPPNQGTGGPRSTSPAPGKSTDRPAASPSKAGGKDDEADDELARTGASATPLVVAGVLAALLLAGGAAGIWLTRGRRGRH
ncbi:hypothetical protein [Streptomyces griseocarneus]|uniref:hypothetical protein n=1 Tax=Streptomyces griseocarneus TaxID=51201 RepID=UPI00167DA654|nr:hypothetical protein [Streptomyces griseocarneus]MBZ6475604.1 hypothetical protein [Streptomyces griseocarneus]GHG69276.1 hypothetical protein GCM10018779_42530 [Streptomyces griseocarneus]